MLSSPRTISPQPISLNPSDNAFYTSHATKTTPMICHTMLTRLPPSSLLPGGAFPCCPHLGQVRAQGPG